MSIPLPDYLARAITENPPVKGDDAVAASVAIREGDVAARDRIVLSCLRLAARVARDEDEFQEMVAAMLERAATYDAAESSPGTHLGWGILKAKKSHRRKHARANAAASAIARARDVRPRRLPKADEARAAEGGMSLDAIRAAPADPDLGQDQVDAAELLELLLSCLTPTDASRLRRIHGIGCEPQTYQQVAEAEGIRATSLETQHVRAMKRLRRIAGLEIFSRYMIDK